ncbi:MAG: hypothetical protein ABEH43_00385, partial [Flavobacteriales bacterium]
EGHVLKLKGGTGIVEKEIKIQGRLLDSGFRKMLALNILIYNNKIYIGGGGTSEDESKDAHIKPSYTIMDFNLNILTKTNKVIDISDVHEHLTRSLTANSNGEIVGVTDDGLIYKIKNGNLSLVKNVEKASIPDENLSFTSILSYKDSSGDIKYATTGMINGATFVAVFNDSHNYTHAEDIQLDWINTYVAKNIVNSNYGETGVQIFKQGDGFVVLAQEVFEPFGDHVFLDRFDNNILITPENMIFKIKDDSSGELIWSRSYGKQAYNEDYEEDDYLSEAAMLSNESSFVLGGYSTYKSKGKNAYLLKTNEVGVAGGCKRKDDIMKKSINPPINIDLIHFDRTRQMEEKNLRVNYSSLRFNMNDLSLYIANYSKNSPKCNKSNGNVTVEIEGGAPDYTYKWETVNDTTVDGPTSDTISTQNNIPCNTVFRVSVEDSGHCKTIEYQDTLRVSDVKFVETHKVDSTGVTTTWSPGAGNNPFNSSSGKVYIKEELRIKSKADLKIRDMTFFFAKDARLVIERGFKSPLTPKQDPPEEGAHLRLDNSTLTTLNCCSDPKYLWRGVTVQGHKDYPQKDNSGSLNNSPQGVLTMKNNSLIENADIAVHLAKKNTKAKGGGGVIKAEDSKFKDNRVGVMFAPYGTEICDGPCLGSGGGIGGGAVNYCCSMVDNLGEFKDCRFTTTGPLNNPDLAPVGMVDMNNTGIIEFKGVKFEDQRYSNSDTPNDGQIGIQSNSSDFRVESSNARNSEFHHFKFGIKASSHHQFKSFVVKNALFQSNHRGIFMRSTNFARIEDNDFFIPDGILRPYSRNVGIYIEQSTGYIVQETPWKGFPPLFQKDSLMWE